VSSVEVDRALIVMGNLVILVCHLRSMDASTVLGWDRPEHPRHNPRKEPAMKLLEPTNAKDCP
jgi:hypothetical protein